MDQANSQSGLPLPSRLLEISRPEFLDAIRSLKPKGNVSNLVKNGDLQIGYLQGQAVFCVNGAQTRRHATGNWPGLVSVTFGFALRFLRAPPAADPLKIGFLDGRLQIDTGKVLARWVELSEPDAARTLGVHLNDVPDDERLLYCPECGCHKEDHIDVRDVDAEHLHNTPRQLYAGLESSAIYRLFRCRACSHKWMATPS